MILQVAAHDLVGGAHADGGGGAGRDGARIDRGEVAARRAARRRGRATAHRRDRAPRDVRRGRRREPRARRRRRRARPASRPVAAASACTVASSGVRPKICRPSRMLSSLMSQSWASSLAMACRLGSPLSSPQSAASPLVPGALDDLVLEEAQAPPVEAVGRGIFLDDAFELGQRPVQAGGAERRRQMADGDGGQPPLGLHRLAGIVDDEGVDHRQRPQHRLGPAFARQRQRLAGQPFQRAVRAEMDQRVDLLGLAQPGIERDVGVARRAVGVVIARLAIGLPLPRAPRSGCSSTRTLPQRSTGRRKASPAGSPQVSASARCRLGGSAFSQAR